MVIAKIKVGIGRVSANLYSRGRQYGLVLTTKIQEAGVFKTEQEAREWINDIFGNSHAWMYETISYIDE